MEFGILPSIASIAFVIVLSLVYFYKKRSTRILNTLYKIFVISVILFATMQIGYVIAYKYLNIYWITFLFWKLYWAFGISCWGTTTIIFIVIIKKLNYNSIKELLGYSKKLKMLCIFFFIVPIFVLISPPYSYDFSLQSNLVYNDDFYAVLEVIYCSAIMIFQLILLFKNYKEVEKKLKITIIAAACIGVLFLILQVVYYETSFFVPCACMYTYIIYFTYTNPDIELINEIYISQSDIEKSSKTKTDFLSNMTYEIKNPLGIITNTCDSLIHLDDFNEEEAKNEIKQIMTSASSLMDIVNNIVNISKIESGQSVLNEKEYSLKTLVNDLHDAAKNKIGEKNVKFIVDLDTNISSVLYGDSAKLNQALTNIILNAINYTEVGKVTFTITGKKNSEFETLLFKISDTGSGIKAEDQPKIFQKGTRLDDSVEKEIEGSGFGLSIAKEHVDSMNGKIWFNSEYRVGSTFFIEVTQKIIDSTPIKDSIDVNDNSNTLLDCSNYKVLIVEDNIPNIKVFKRILEKYKIQVDFVTSGKDCIYKIKNEEKFDIIFIDHFMPEMDGIETIKILKSLDGYTLPPIVCVSANSLPGMKEMYIQNGFDDFLSKPINSKELDRIIRKFFSKK